MKNSVSLRHKKRNAGPDRSSEAHLPMHLITTSIANHQNNIQASDLHRTAQKNEITLPHASAIRGTKIIKTSLFHDTCRARQKTLEGV